MLQSRDIAIFSNDVGPVDYRYILPRNNSQQAGFGTTEKLAVCRATYPKSAKIRFGEKILRTVLFWYKFIENLLFSSHCKNMHYTRGRRQWWQDLVETIIKGA